MSPRAYRRITLVAFCALAFIVVTGAGVRLTGSGLGCPDWPTCYDQQFHAKLQYHPMVEFVNRTITGLVSVAVIVAVLGALVRKPRRRDLTWLSLGLVAGVVAQIALGAFTVLTHLTPTVVMAHFLASMVLLLNAWVLHHRAGEADGPLVSRVAPDLRLAVRAVFVAGVMVLVAGTVVTGTGPHGGDENVERLPFFLPDVARLHGIAAWLLLACTLGVVWLARRTSAPAAVHRGARLLVYAACVQGAIGYLQYHLGVPVGLVALHIAGAVTVWTCVVHLQLTIRGPVAISATTERERVSVD